jgi:hypothetical protein
MATYHYLLCDSAGWVESVQSSECDNDTEAHEEALKILPRQGICAIEVWRGQRHVGRVGEPGKLHQIALPASIL